MSELKTTSLSHKDNNTGTPNITMYPDGTTSLNYAATGFKNQLINGSMLIGQRNITDVVDWTADRWRGLNVAVRYYVSNQGQFYRSIGPLGNDKNIVQPIELQAVGSRGVFQEGSQWTFSLYTDAVAPAAAVYFSTASYNGTNLLETAFTLTATGESEGNLNRWAGTVTLPAGSIGSSTCLVLSVAIQDNERFVGAQLEPGPTASDFEFRFIGTELALCQRYFQKLVGNHLSGVSNGVDASRVGYNFPTTMRIPPEFIPPSGNISVWNGTSIKTGSVVKTYMWSNAMEMDISGQTGTLVGGAVIVYIGSFTSDDYIGLDAEL